jgi:hypothetical protein
MRRGAATFATHQQKTDDRLGFTRRKALGDNAAASGDNQRFSVQPQ